LGEGASFAAAIFVTKALAEICGRLPVILAREDYAAG
jgi:hypothetical protein